MEKLQKKLKKQGGFTLVEMLIVVAIIAILIAVSIPMVSGALDRAKEATDAANVRAAKAAASITKLDPGSKVAGKEINWEDTNGKNVINAYDAEKGIIVGLSADAQAPATYGKKEKGRIYLVIDDDVVYYQWGESTPTETDPSVDNSGWKTEVKVSE